jgi:hypothetical protein
MRRMIILILFLQMGILSLANNEVPAYPAANIIWIHVWLSFLFGVLLTVWFRYLNQRSMPAEQRTDAGLPLRGWIILPGFILVLQLVIQIYAFWNADFYLKSAGFLWEAAGGVIWHVLIILEMLMTLFAIAGTGAMIYWYFGRRDIFPFMFVYYVGYLLSVQFILLVLYNTIDLPAVLVSVRHVKERRFFAMVVYAIIWLSFLTNSENVKQTFVYPYE